MTDKAGLVGVVGGKYSAGCPHQVAMRHDHSSDDSGLVRWPSRLSSRRARLVLLGLFFAAPISVAICVAAIVARAPAAVAPLVAAVCVGGPLFAGWEAPAAFAALRAERAERAGVKALAGLRRGLKDLPETDHPLGL